jgi:hypothetical protein
MLASGRNREANAGRPLLTWDDVPARDVHQTYAMQIWGKCGFSFGCARYNLSGVELDGE